MDFEIMYLLFLSILPDDEEKKQNSNENEALGMAKDELTVA